MLVSIPFGLILGLLGSLTVKSIELLRAHWKRRGVSPMKTMILSALVTSASGVIVHLLTAREEEICTPWSYLDYRHATEGHHEHHHGQGTPNPGSCNWGLGMEVWGM